MSKTFDEGGAKGLLLVNLGVGSDGCNIVFDSSSTDGSKPDNGSNEEARAEGSKVTEEATPRREEGMVDISNLTTKLDGLLQDSSSGMWPDTTSTDALESLPLVPQLASLRAQFADLEAQGFVSELAAPDMRGRKRNNNHQYYGVTEQEEKEADRSIHQEALERSRATIARSVVDSPGSKGGDDFAADDFGGGFDDGNDDDDGFDAFMASSNDQRVSDISFAGSVVADNLREMNSSPTAMLDALSNSQSFWAAGSDYAYWNTKSTNLLGNSNDWAGVAHWNTKSRRAPTKAAPKKKKKATKKKQPTNLVDLANPANLDDLLASSAPKKPKSAQWGKTTVAKHTRNENVLPLDAGIGVDKLASLFLRPDSVLKKEITPKKQVGFVDVAWENDDNASFGGGGAFDDGDDDDDNEGPGFALANDNDDNDDDGEFRVEELEGIRKVDKIQVGYATVAKKVDVKRLKRDLWKELEDVFSKRKAVDYSDMGDESKDRDEDQMEDEDDASQSPDEPRGMSFQKAVSDLEQAKSQVDATLPFYFICVLHLANEKGLRLDSKGLQDFDIFHDENCSPSF